LTQASRFVLVLAIAFFILSFFLTGVRIAPDRDPDPPRASVRGFGCAYLALIYPWARSANPESDPSGLKWFAYLISGWINPVFIITIVALYSKRARRLGWVLRIVLLGMSPFCWIVFREDLMDPAIGYFLWTGSMVLALFSSLLLSDGFYERKREHALSRGS